MLLALSTGAIVGIVAGAVVLLLLIIGIALYNGLIRLRNAADEGWSTIDVKP